MVRYDSTPGGVERRKGTDSAILVSVDFPPLFHSLHSKNARNKPNCPVKSNIIGEHLTTDQCFLRWGKCTALDRL